MKRGKELRDSQAQPIVPGTPKEITALKFVMVEALGAFRMRFISNDDLIRDIEAQGSLSSFLADVDELYREFRKRFETESTAWRPN